MIQSENTFLVGYVIFDKKQGKAEVDVVKEATKVIEGKIQNGELKLTKGVSYKFAGNYEQQERATARLMIVVPLALLIVLLVPVQDPYGLVDSFLRCLRGFCRRLYPALAVRSGLVHELFAGGSQYAGPVPDAYH